MASLRTALLFQDGNFVGREYCFRLRQAGLTPDLLISVGKMPEHSIQYEIERTAGRWRPPEISVPVSKFESISDPALWTLLKAEKIELGIQAGVGILKPDMIASLPLGILNVHPGKLPEYRGNACPERALLNGDDIWATAHMIDAGIDTGPVVHAKKYDLARVRDYFDMRAGLYAHCAATLIEALAKIETAKTNLSSILQKQDESHAHYWPALTAEEAERVKQWRR